ncbi:multiheme c-type cytochrome [Desulfocurvus sp. DL9XJH121]
MARISIAAALLILGLSVAARAELFGDYVGHTACADCHQGQVQGWKTTPHARAFEDLKHQGAEKQSVPGCVRCHVVAMDADGGFMDMELTPELKDVQCEACHGPGRAHVESQDPKDIVARPDEASCRVCHTEGQDRNFDYAVKSRLVHGEQ